MSLENEISLSKLVTVRISIALFIYILLKQQIDECWSVGLQKFSMIMYPTLTFCSIFES